MQVTAAEVLGRDHLARGRPHQGRTTEEDRALVAHDHRLVAHRRHVGAPGGARTHHGGDLGDAGLREVRLVEEDAPEVVAVGEHLVLGGQVGAAGVDEVDARQVVLEGDLLGPEVLLDRHRVVGAALHRGVVGHDDAEAPAHPTHPGDQAGPRRLPRVEAVGGQRRQLEERGARVEEALDPFTGQELAPFGVAASGRVRTALAGARREGPHLRDRPVERLTVRREGVVGGVDVRREGGCRRRRIAHGVSRS